MKLPQGTKAFSVTTSDWPECAGFTGVNVYTETQNENMKEKK